MFYTGMGMEMKKQVYNPYLPSWEYIPDGEPYVFGDRVYVFGSHDRYNGHVFCLNDYVCWSAPLDSLGEWHCSGTIYRKTDDPLNKDGKMCLYAPDVTRGADGRYYLYYVLDKVSVVSVAVAEKPDGPYKFYGYVHDKNGNRIGERSQDEPQFDPAVLTEGDKTYLYTGFCAANDASRHGAMGMALGKDMLTVIEEPRIVLPNHVYGKGTGFEEHEFFEAPSIRKKGDYYYLIYSSVVMHELCYAVSKNPLEGFTYGDVIVSNCDVGITNGKPAEKPVAYGANNHGSIIDIMDQWYIFYHRHTNHSWYCRQGCAEPIVFQGERICQAEMTSCGLNGSPLRGEGTYPSYIACNLFTDKEEMYVGGEKQPYIMQDGCDGDYVPAYITNMTDHATAGFKYFSCKGIKKLGICVRGYARGEFEVRTVWDGPVCGKIPVEFTNVWENYEAPVKIEDGVQALYLTFRGEGTADLKSFTFDDNT